MVANRSAAVLVAGLLVSTVASATSYAIIIPVKQKGSGPFYRIKRAGRWGYVNRQGQVVIPPRFTDAGDFFHGLAKVRVGGYWGYLSASGKIAIPARYDAATDFNQNRAVVTIGEKAGIIDSAGSFVVSSTFDEIRPYAGGMAAVWVNAKRKQSGNVV
jgi:hypothetical protein